VLRQHLATDVPFTVQRVVEMGRHPLQVTGATDPATDALTVAQLLRDVDLEDRAHLQLSALSGGEQRRVALARALAQGAPLLLLDEPAASLDVAHQELTMRLLRDRVASTGGALVILHDLNLAASYADRVVIMHGGRVWASGPPGEVMAGDVLSEVYRQRLQVKRHPTRDRPLVIVVD
jgi:iron complex transport system ATP-binding protein